MTLAAVSDVEAAIQFDFTNDSDPVIVGYLDAADQFIKAYLGREVEAADYQGAYLPDQTLLALPDWPIQELDITEAGVALTAGDDFIGYDPRGIIGRVWSSGDFRRWDHRPGAVVIAARLGYEAGSVPAEIVRACALLAGSMFTWASANLPAVGSSGWSGPVVSETVADHTVRFDTVAVAAATSHDAWERSEARQLLQAHRRLPGELTAHRVDLTFSAFTP